MLDSLEEKKQPVLVALRGLLRPVGFRKRGSTFVRELHHITHVVALQSSSQTTAQCAVLTVNVCVTVPSALNSWEPPFSPWSGQWRARLGELGPAATETWWSVSDSESAVRAAREVVDLVRDFALPALDNLSTVDALLQRLDSQTSRGLTPTEQANAATRIRKRVLNSEEARSN